MSRTSPLRTFNVPTTRRYVKKGAFAEHATTVACGSDHGSVYIFRSSSEDVVQTLRHDNSELLGCLDPYNVDQLSAQVLIQTVEVRRRIYASPNVARS
jgi:hypothetical protein